MGFVLGTYSLKRRARQGFIRAASEWLHRLPRMDMRSGMSSRLRSTQGTKSGQPRTRKYTDRPALPEHVGRRLGWCATRRALALTLNVEYGGCSAGMYGPKAEQMQGWLRARRHHMAPSEMEGSDAAGWAWWARWRQLGIWHTEKKERRVVGKK